MNPKQIRHALRIRHALSLSALAVVTLAATAPRIAQASPKSHRNTAAILGGIAVYSAIKGNNAVAIASGIGAAAAYDQYRDERNHQQRYGYPHDYGNPGYANPGYGYPAYPSAYPTYPGGYTNPGGYSVYAGGYPSYPAAYPTYSPGYVSPGYVSPGYVNYGDPHHSGYQRPDRYDRHDAYGVTPGDPHHGGYVVPVPRYGDPHHGGSYVVPPRPNDPHHGGYAAPLRRYDHHDRRH